MAEVTVREHARLTTQPGFATLDCHSISASAFTYLCELSASLGQARLIQLESGLSLRVDNYVGVIETPCGTTLEVLPKDLEHALEAESSRKLLLRMLGVVLSVKPRLVGVADIQLLKRPLTEWVMRQFLQELDHLVKRGLRFEYREVEEELSFLRGRLDVARQVRQRPGRQHIVNVRHEVFLPDRPENRLLRSALERVRQATRDPSNWRLAHELSVLLEQIPKTVNQASDFAAWREDRLMAHYSAIKPWCALVLGETMPTAQRGPQRGISMLFPMEKLFEEYVARCLRPQLASGIKMTCQASSKSLCHHEGAPIFQLQPDMVLRGAGKTWVLDAKWKLLDGSNRAKNYGISQPDIYQLFAYGHQYMEGEGDMYLVYPKTSQFALPLSDFAFSGAMRLKVVPFDLEAGRLVLEGSEFLSPLAAVPSEQGEPA